ncbi:hypothetical protein [Halorarius halobius]|uniref:hypothetical protein n=1 Tax=Halorarius halobius TaxID=2962671 RepID=UPI0020CF2347|nr:hypothetical protein [Halorarius halobius]
MDPRWRRPSPVVGVLGGLLVAVFLHLGLQPDPSTDGWLWAVVVPYVDPVALVREHTLPAYLGFAAFGGTLGWVGRRLWPSDLE